MSTRDGVPRLQARIALTYAALCMAGQTRHLRSATRSSSAELERQILPDGGHISRNPGALIELLLDLLPLRQAFTARNVAPPPALLNAIDRMMPMLRFFRHGDGTFALFNGMGPTSPDLLATILAYDDARGAPLANAPHSGYQRVEAGSIGAADGHRLPAAARSVSHEAHAGCLSFELSARQQRIVVNCGLPASGKENWRQVARATAAHSTVTFNDTSSCRVPRTAAPGGASAARRSSAGRASVAGRPRGPGARRHPGARLARRLCRPLRRHPPARPPARRPTATSSTARTLFLPADGDMLPANVLDEFAVRFHLHPAVKANRLTDGHGAMLMLPNKDVWTFNAYEDRVEIEESVYLAGLDGPRRTVQIVIYGRARKVARVHWTLSHAPQPDRPPAAPRGEEPELPL